MDFIIEVCNKAVSPPFELSYVMWKSLEESAKREDQILGRVAANNGNVIQKQMKEERVHSALSNPSLDI